MSAAYGALVPRPASTFASWEVARCVIANDRVARSMIASCSVAREPYATGASL